MKEIDRRKYSNAYQREVKKIENQFLKKLSDLLIEQFSEVAADLRLRGVDGARQKIDRILIDTRIAETIKSLYKTAGLMAAHKTFNEIQASAIDKQKSGSISFNEQWIKDILDYFRMYLINKAVVPITKTSKAIIMAILDRGSKDGWSIERMAKELERPLLQMSRARLVVRTETAKAAYYGRRLGEQDSGYETEKEWISAHDKRVRHGHREVDGEKIDEGQRFQVNIYQGNKLVGHDMMRGPGDPEASAANVCNCRCTDACTAKRDTRGRLIKKPSQRVAVIMPGQIQRPQITLI